MTSPTQSAGWLRGVLRSIVTRRRVCKTWAVAGKRCFKTLVAELRDRGAAHARALAPFSKRSPRATRASCRPTMFLSLHRADKPGASVVQRRRRRQARPAAPSAL